MTVTLYSKGCTPCINKSLWRSLKNRAAEKRVLLNRKDINKDLSAREASATYGIAVPFIVDENNIAYSVEAWLA